MPHAEEYSNDPKAYELTVTLHEGDNLVYEAEMGLPEGYKIPESKPAANFRPVTLVTRRVNSKLRPAPAALQGSADTAISAVKLAWDFIKDGAPKASADGASTAVLGSEDMAWDHYAEAKKFETASYHYSIKNALGNVCVQADYVVRGTCQAQYDGTKDVHPGDYMPNVEVYCSMVDVGFGCGLNASAALSHISNVGEKGGKVIPDFYATLTFSPWTAFWTGVDTFPFELRGDRGVV